MAPSPLPGTESFPPFPQVERVGVRLNRYDLTIEPFGDKMLHLLLVEDNHKLSTALKNGLEATNRVQVIHQCASGEAAQAFCLVAATEAVPGLFHKKRIFFTIAITPLFCYNPISSLSLNSALNENRFFSTRK